MAPNGRVIWHKCKGLRGGGTPPTIDRDGNIYVGLSAPPIREPIVGRDGKITVMPWRGWLYSLTRHGRLRWRLRLPMPGIASPPVIGAPGRIYVGGTDRHLYCIE